MGTSTTEVLALAASVASAIGGGFSAWAAWQSAKSARHAQESADSAGRRAQLRDLTETANGIVVESERIKAKANDLRQAYRSLAILSGASGGSREQLVLSAIDEKVGQAKGLADHARLFTNGARSLHGSTEEDIDRVQLRLSDGLERARAIREEMDIELARVNGQCAERREAMDRRP